MKLEDTFYDIKYDAYGRVLPNEYNYDMYLDDTNEVDFITTERITPLSMMMIIGKKR